MNVLKATGRNIAGGSNIGSIVGFNGTVDRIGCTGVPKAGDEDGTWSFDVESAADLNVAAASPDIVMLLWFMVTNYGTEHLRVRLN